MKNYYEFYTKKVSSRFTARDKQKFRSQIEKDFRELGWDTTVMKRKSGFSKVTNIVAGDVKFAKVVVAVPYDTPAKVYWPNSKYYPLNGTRSNLKGFLPLYGPALIIYGIILAVLSFQNQFFNNEVMKVAFSIFSMVILAFMMYYLLHGFRNKHNDTRNTASIIAVLEIAKSLSKDKKRKVAFLFTDKNVHRHAGAKVAMQELEKMGKNPTIISLNCIGRGKNMVIGYLANSRKLAQDLNRKLDVRLKQVQITENMRMQSAMEHFPKAVVIASGMFDEKQELCVMGTGTSKDNYIEDENISKVVQIITKYIETI